MHHHHPPSNTTTHTPKTNNKNTNKKLNNKKKARTPLVAMVDVDLVVSNTLFDWLRAPGNYDAVRAETARRAIFVLPAFETAPQKNMTLAHELADSASTMTKPNLAKLVSKRLIYQFALYIFRQGHNCTDYAKWFKADAPYEVEYHDGYEPWFIIDRFANPFYDQVFRGYGWNKARFVLFVCGCGCCCRCCLVVCVLVVCDRVMRRVSALTCS